MALLELGLSLIALAILVVLGLVFIIVIIGSLLFFLPAAVIAVVVWLITKDLFLAGVAFIAVTILMILVRR